MEMMNGWKIYSKKEMDNDKAIEVFSDLIQNIERDIPLWKEESGMRKLLECQREAYYKAISALRTAQ